MIVKELFEQCNDERERVIDSLIDTYYSDTEELLDRHRYGRFKKMYEDMPDDELISFLIDKARENYNIAYDDILSIDPILHPDIICISILREYLITYSTSWDTFFVYKDEFMDKFEYRKNPESYEELINSYVDEGHIVTTWGFMFEDRADILGYTVSPISTILYSPYDVAAAILWEITWFGYTEEESKTNRTMTEESLEEIQDMDEDLDLDEVEDILDEEDDEESDVDISDFSIRDDDIAVSNFIIQNEYFKKLYDYYIAHPEE